MQAWAQWATPMGIDRCKLTVSTASTSPAASPWRMKQPQTLPICCPRLLLILHPSLSTQVLLGTVRCANVVGSESRRSAASAQHSTVDCSICPLLTFICNRYACLAGLSVGLAAGAVLHLYTRKQLWQAAEQVDDRLANATLTRPQPGKRELMTAAAARSIASPSARQVLPSESIDAERILSAAAAAAAVLRAAASSSPPADCSAVRCLLCPLTVERRRTMRSCRGIVRYAAHTPPSRGHSSPHNQHNLLLPPQLLQSRAESSHCIAALSYSIH
jgi:hypothetical protein